MQQLLRERLEDDNVGVLYGDMSWTWREHLADAAARGRGGHRGRRPGPPLHVGVLLGNTPDMLRSMAAAALGGYVLGGLNTTRRGDALLADVRRADCQMVLVNGEHAGLLDGARRSPDVRVVDVDSAEWAEQVAAAGPLVPHAEVGAMDTFMMIFTSGTSGEPKAVQVPHIFPLFSGANLVDRFSVTSDDVCYVSMPLFHSNAVVAGWAVAACSGATIVPARFSASRFLDDVRHYGATYMNYVGKPLAYVLATPEQPDDADNPLRVAFGNEASDRDIEEFARRFDCHVMDGFGSTESAVIVTRVAGTPRGLDRAGLRGRRDLQLRDGHRVPDRGVRRERRAAQRRRGGRRAGQHPGRRLLPGLLQRPVRQRRADAARHVLVRRPRLQGRRRLRLPRRPHRRLDAGRRREPRRRADRADLPAPARRQPGRRLRGPRPQRRRPGDGRDRAPGRRRP